MTNVLGNESNKQNEWLDEILCTIYKQAGATSCEGSGESLLDLVVKWPENCITLWDKMEQIKEATYSIQDTMNVMKDKTEFSGATSFCSLGLTQIILRQSKVM